MFTKKCVICGKEFETNFFRQTICGAECKAELNRRNMKRNNDKRKMAEDKIYQKVCAICGKNFEAKDSRKKYCSEKCCKDAHNQLVRNRKHGTTEETKEETKRPMTPALERFITKIALMISGERDVFPDSVNDATSLSFSKYNSWSD